jgi:hypothetical protein
VESAAAELAAFEEARCMPTHEPTAAVNTQQLRRGKVVTGSFAVGSL